MDEGISSRALEVGICEKYEAVGREGGRIAADLEEGRLMHCQRWMKGGFLKVRTRRSIMARMGTA